MSWARLDDKYHSDGKMLSAGWAAMGVFSWGLSYCADQLTDGYVPRNALPSVPGTSRAVALLVHIGVWGEASNGWRVTNYLRYQPTRDEVLKDREAGAIRRSKWRSKRVRNTEPDTEANASPDADASAAPARSRPVPGPTTLSHSVRELRGSREGRRENTEANASGSPSGLTCPNCGLPMASISEGCLKCARDAFRATSVETSQ